MTTSMNEQPITFFNFKPKKIEEQKQTELVAPTEVALEPEVQERLAEMKGSANRYAWIIADAVASDIEPTPELLAELLINQKHELPHLVSGVMERACNLQCAHCLYQEEKSSAVVSEEAHLGERIINIVSQMPIQSRELGAEYSPKFLSIGRILRPWHLDVFTELRRLRPDVRLGVIDNGSYTKILSKWPEDFKFDWMDISVDGVEESHNEQRQSPKAFAQAVEGLKRAREVTKSPEEDGQVSSLLTLTKINAHDIEAVADALLVVPDGEVLPLADKFNITTVGPTNEINRKLETDNEDFQAAWGQIKNVCQKYNHDGKKRVVFGIYRIQDIEKLAVAVGEKRFLEAFTATEDSLPIAGERNFLDLEFDGVPIQYQPLSIWTPEEFPIDADGSYLAAYAVKHTIDELQSGRAKDGTDTSAYTFERLTEKTDFRESFERAVDAYWMRFGKQRLQDEIAAFKRIREKAKSQ